MQLEIWSFCQNSLKQNTNWLKTWKSWRIDSNKPTGNLYVHLSWPLPKKFVTFRKKTFLFFPLSHLSSFSIKLIGPLCDHCVKTAKPTKLISNHHQSFSYFSLIPSSSWWLLWLEISGWFDEWIMSWWSWWCPYPHPSDNKQSEQK